MQNIGQDIIHKIYNTETTQYQKPDYANRCVVYYDKSFFNISRVGIFRQQ